MYYSFTFAKLFSFFSFYPVALFVIDALTDKGEILVYYYKEELKHFHPPEIWVAAVSRTHTEKQQSAVRWVYKTVLCSSFHTNALKPHS